ncbi:MAG: DUF1684 domain-containing protein [Bacteroidota bacterium]
MRLLSPLAHRAWPLAGLFLAGWILVVAPACSPEAPALDRPAIRAEWESWRASRDSLYASDASPVPDTLRDAFQGLVYFEYDSTHVVAASLQPSLETDTLLLGTSTGEPRPVVASGVLSFRTPDGRPHRLTAYHPIGPFGSTRLFVPFRDQTSGSETYGGGRYMDVSPGEEGVVVLDFNQAYHPTCVVDPTFSCPLPPPENALEVLVTAGERFPDDASGG